MKLTIIFVITLFISTLILSGQNNVQWVTYLEGYRIANVANVGDFLWLSTSKEVYRFEKQTGYTTLFDFVNLELPTNYAITTVKCDKNGLPWVGAEYTGTLKMTKEGEWTLLPQVSTDESERGTHEILVTKNGIVWTSTINILTRYQENAEDNFTTNGSIISLAEDNEGNLWIGTANYLQGHYEGLVKYDGENWNIYDSSPTGSIPLGFSSIIFDKNGTLWLAGYRGIDYVYTDLVEFDGTSWNVNSPPFYGESFYIREIAIDGAGIKWLASNKGLVAFDGENWTTYNVLNSGIPSDDVHSILIDSDGTKWIGTENGLATFNEKNINVTAGLDSKKINNINLFPNPANDFITLNMKDDLHYSISEILTIHGKVIKSFNMDKNQNRIDVSDLPCGIYLVRVQSHEKYFTGKFVKQ